MSKVATGNFLGTVEWVAEVIKVSTPDARGEARQRDANAASNSVTQPLNSTDPPYYDNIGYIVM